jgi:hypothetical protein
MKIGLSGLENRMIRFFQRTPISVFLSNLAPIALLSCFNCLLSFISILSFSGDLNSDNSSSNSDDDIENDTYVPSPRARPHGKGLASASGNGAERDDKIEEEVEEGADGDDGEEEEEVFDAEEINPPNYVDM